MIMVEDIKNNLPKLFKKLINPNINPDDNQKIKDFDKTINSNNYDKSLSYFQNVILAKMMIGWEKKNKNEIKLSKDYKKVYREYFDYPNNENSEIDEEEQNIFYELGLNVEAKIEDFFSSLIINFLKEKEKSKAKIIKLFWNEINLFNYEINDIIKEKLIEYMEKDNFYDELCKDYQLFELKNSEILKEIYDFYDFKTIEKIKMETLKEYGDKERQFDDFGRMLQIKEPDSKNINESFADEINKEKREKIPIDELKEVLKEFRIVINLQYLENEEVNFSHHIKDKEIKLYKNGEYDCKKPGEKNYLEYIKFNDKVEKFIKDNIKNIKKKGKIVLILKFKSKEQKNQSQLKENKNQNLYVVDCESHFEKNDENKVDEVIGRFNDDNVLINGISGKNPGFIFLVNELCNDDYDIIK